MSGGGVRVVTLCILASAAGAAIWLGNDSVVAPDARIEPSADGNYADELRALDARIAFYDERAGQAADDWTLYESLAACYLERARLTGKLENYALAERALASSFSVAAAGSGPFLLRAQLNSSLHRWDRVEADLLAIERGVIVDAQTRAAVESERAAVHEQCGRHDAALAAFRRAWELQPSAPTACAIARLKASLGDDAEAHRWMDEADAQVRGPSHVLRAWLCLQRGLLELERGRYAQALALYERGDSILSGWWLITEHMAEAHALLGHGARALSLYERATEVTDDPQFMDSIAALLRAAGRTEEATRWAARAAPLYEKRLEEYPEAFAGHALDYYLEWDPTPEKALQLAERDFLSRPGPAARIQLARALLRAERARDARAALAPALDEAMAGGWRSAKLYTTAASVSTALGELERAADELQRARAINPQAGPE